MFFSDSFRWYASGQIFVVYVSCRLLLVYRPYRLHWYITSEQYITGATAYILQVDTQAIYDKPALLYHCGTQTTRSWFQFNLLIKLYWNNSNDSITHYTTASVLRY